MRVITVAYYALVRPDLVPLAAAGGDAALTAWREVRKLRPTHLAFDHHEIVQRAVATIAERVEATSIASSLVPSTFTIPELRHVHALLSGEPGDGSIKAAYIVKHGTCSASSPLQDILHQIDEQVFVSIQGTDRVPINIPEAPPIPPVPVCTTLGNHPIANYVHSIGWMSEGQTPSSPTRGGFILGAWATDNGDAEINVTYTFGLDTRPPYAGVLKVIPTENNSDSDGFAGGGMLSSIRDGLEGTGLTPAQGVCGGTPSVPLPGTLELTAFAQQSKPVPTAGGGVAQCTPQPEGFPSDDQLNADPMLAFSQKYCDIGLTIKIALSSGEDHLGIPSTAAAPYRNQIEQTLLSTIGGGQYWSNFRCNFHPTYSDKPACEVVTRASRIVAMPDRVELVWFDGRDGGGFTDYSSPATFADGSLVATEGFAIFVLLNNTIGSRTPNVSPLCQDQPVRSAFVYHPYAHDEYPPAAASGGAPLMRRR